MTHPTLGYTNFRFDGDDAVHMAAFNGAGHVIACNAEGPTEHDLWPHGVDAPVDCESCLRAREADWWMAQAEQQRREGAEAVWPESTSEELHNVAARVMSQVDAKVEATILGTGERTEPWLGVLSMNDPAPLAVTVEASDDYFFGQDKMAIKARQGDHKTYRTVDHVSQRSPEELNEAVAATLHQLDRERVPEDDPAPSAGRRLVRGTRGPAMSSHFEDDDSGGLTQGFDEASPSIVDDPDAVRLLAERLKDPVQDAVKVIHVANPGSFLGEAIDRHDRETKQARYLARSPLSHLASDAGKSGAPEEILFEPPSMRDVTSVDLTPEERVIGPASMRNAYEMARTEWEQGYPDREEPPEVPDADEVEPLPASGFGWTELPAAPPDVDTLPEPANWCHVHNRTTEAGREECSECDGEQDEDRKAGES